MVLCFNYFNERRLRLMKLMPANICLYVSFFFYQSDIQSVFIYCNLLISPFSTSAVINRLQTAVAKLHNYLQNIGNTDVTGTT